MDFKKSQQKASKGKSQRKMKNFLLMPRTQIRLGAYSILLATGLLAGLVGIIYIKMGEIVSLVVQLTDAEDEVEKVLNSYVQGMAWWIVIAICIYILANLSLSIWYTHRLVGPTYAFRRHVRALIGGDLSAKTKLRTGDAFGELADDLNLLSDKLAAENSEEGEAEMKTQSPIKIQKP